MPASSPAPDPDPYPFWRLTAEAEGFSPQEIKDAEGSTMMQKMLHDNWQLKQENQALEQKASKQRKSSANAFTLDLPYLDEPIEDIKIQRANYSIFLKAITTMKASLYDLYKYPNVEGAKVIIEMIERYWDELKDNPQTKKCVVINPAEESSRSIFYGMLHKNKETIENEEIMKEIINHLSSMESKANKGVRKTAASNTPF